MDSGAAESSESGEGAGGSVEGADGETEGAGGEVVAADSESDAEIEGADPAALTPPSLS